MAAHLITESRIRSHRFYAVTRDNKIRLYTSSIAAARYWIKNCSDAPPVASTEALTKPQVVTEVARPAEEAAPSATS